MSLKSWDIEEIERRPFKEPPFTKYFVATIRFLAKCPPIKERIAETVGGLSGNIFR